MNYTYLNFPVYIISYFLPSYKRVIYAIWLVWLSQCH